MKQIKTKPFSATRSVVQRGTVAILCTFLFGLFLISGCKKDKPNGIKEPEYPIDIQFTEYTLSNTCQWTNLAYNNTVIIINNDEELQQYITSIDGIYPEIDFSEHTLLVTSGKTDFKVAKKTISKLQQLSESEYELDVEIFMDGTEASYQWAVSTLTEKVKEESKVKLNITCDKSDYPVEIPFTEYITMIWYGFNWINLDYDEKVILINSEEQFDYYINVHPSCTYTKVDFSKNSLLLVSGFTDDGIAAYIAKKLQKISANEYELDAEIIVNTSIEPKGWVFGLIVDKLSAENTFKLNVSYREEPDENVPYQEVCDEHLICIRTFELIGVLDFYTDSIPEQLKNNIFAKYMIYDRKNDKGSVQIYDDMVTNVPVMFLCNGNICNFPDFAKEWRIPSEGIKIYYKGTFYYRGGYDSSPVKKFGSLVLETLVIE